MSQPNEEIVKVLPEGFRLLDFRISGGFLLATVCFPEDDGEGSWLASQQPEGWKELCLTGGAFCSEDLDEFEVPQELQAGLLECYRV